MTSRYMLYIRMSLMMNPVWYLFSISLLNNGRFVYIRTYYYCKICTHCLMIK